MRSLYILLDVTFANKDTVNNDSILKERSRQLTFVVETKMLSKAVHLFSEL